MRGDERIRTAARWLGAVLAYVRRGRDRCPQCNGDAGDNYFDRSICPCRGGTMHTRCAECGFALDGCEYEVGCWCPERVS